MYILNTSVFSPYIIIYSGSAPWLFFLGTALLQQPLLLNACSSKEISTQTLAWLPSHIYGTMTRRGIWHTLMVNQINPDLLCVCVSVCVSVCLCVCLSVCVFVRALLLVCVTFLLGAVQCGVPWWGVWLFDDVGIPDHVAKVDPKRRQATHACTVSTFPFRPFLTPWPKTTLLTAATPFIISNMCMCYLCM